MLENKLNKMVNKAMEILTKCNIPLPNVPVEINPRLRTTYGYSEYTRSGKVIKLCIAKFVLEYGTDEIILNTLIHEMLHAVSAGHGHKGLWLEYANRVKEVTGIVIQQYSTKEEDDIIERAKKESEIFKYKVVCDCGQEWTYKSNNKTVQNTSKGKCRCPYCDSILSVVQGYFR